MMHTRRLPRVKVAGWAVVASLPAAIWSTLVFTLYAFAELRFLRVPFLPIATIGTAVAFYVGFKNNASYERFWEGRKIWGGVVNASRAFATGVLSYVEPTRTSEAAIATRRLLIYRHLAWMNALRLQLRRTSRFFDNPARTTKKRLEDHAEHMRNDWDLELSPFLDPAELAHVSAQVNAATHLVLRQGTDLAQLVEDGRLDLFRQLELMGLLKELFDLQGKCERIKNTPFPRQYAEYSRVFTRAFVFLVPLGMLDVFGDHIDKAVAGEAWMWALPMVVAASLVAWVFQTMETIGDASEDPFERSMNDVPMNALCVAIERDLRQMLGETDVRGPEAPIDGLLY